MCKGDRLGGGVEVLMWGGVGGSEKMEVQNPPRDRTCPVLEITPEMNHSLPLLTICPFHRSTLCLFLLTTHSLLLTSHSYSLPTTTHFTLLLTSSYYSLPHPTHYTLLLTSLYYLLLSSTYYTSLLSTHYY